MPVLLARGPFLLVFGLAGAALAYFYTAPPLRLSARRGLGEFSVILAFDPLLTAGTVYASTGTVDAAAFLIGVPMGLLAGANLWVNEFPDADADAMAGKNPLLVTVGKRMGRWGYAVLVGAAFISVAWLTWAHIFPSSSLGILLAVPLAARATQTVLAHYLDRKLAAACRATTQLHALGGLLLIVAMIWKAY